MCGHSCSASKSNLETPALSKSYIENLRDMFIIASDTCLCGSMSSSYPAHIWRHPSTHTQSSLLVSFCPLASSITSGSTLWSSQRGSHEGLLDSKLFRDQGFLSLLPRGGTQTGIPLQQNCQVIPLDAWRVSHICSAPALLLRSVKPLFPLFRVSLL